MCALAVVFVFGLGQLGAQTVPSSGLVGYWTGDGTPNDSSTVANHGAWSGTVAYVSGVAGSAFNFTDGTSRVSIADNGAYDFSAGDLTVGFWFNLNSTTGNHYFLAQDNGSGASAKWVADYNGGTNQFEFQYYGPAISNNVLTSPTIPLSASTWYQLTATKSGTSYSLYLNGTFLGSQTATDAFPNPTNPFTLGFAEQTVGGPLGFAGGSLDEVVLYNRVLTGSEISGLAAIPEPAVSVFFASLAALAVVGAHRWRRRLSS